MILAQSVSQNPNDPHLGHALAVVGNAKINDQEKLIYWNPWDTELSIQDADSSLLHLSFNSNFYMASLWFNDRLLKSNIDID